MKSGVSFFRAAAWYSFVVPFVASVSWFLFVAAHQVSNVSGKVWFLAVLSSFALGIASLFGIPSHGCKGILWKAVIGIVASMVAGWFALMIWGQSWPG
jgi:hypothetical protein